MAWKKLLLKEWQWLTEVRAQTIRLDEERCRGCWTCYDVCPVGCCVPDRARGKIALNPAPCVACGACVLQCPEEALALA
jgi:MinD superfamily P-loop ATPase